MTGALIGLSASAGLLLLVSGWLRTRRPALDQRVLPYVRDVHPYAAGECTDGRGRRQSSDRAFAERAR